MRFGGKAFRPDAFRSDAAWRPERRASGLKPLPWGCALVGGPSGPTLFAQVAAPRSRSHKVIKRRGCAT
ncbi:DUF6053 domain-containing protein [Lysobacter enzymogenes]|uniref:DUF6053 domain-containing protein n=1 Tax=Lysobacter enzymogenes TaxID=69 RepID=UPI003D18A45B